MLCNKLIKDCVKASQMDQWIEHWRCNSKVLCKEEQSGGTVDCHSKLQTTNLVGLFSAIRLLDTLKCSSRISWARFPSFIRPTLKSAVSIRMKILEAHKNQELMKGWDEKHPRYLFVSIVEALINLSLESSKIVKVYKALL